MHLKPDAALERSAFNLEDAVARSPFNFIGCCHATKPDEAFQK